MNKRSTKGSLPEAALTDEDLDKVSAGGTSNTTTKGTAPKESLSLNFSEIKFTYTSQ